jgi:glyoxylase-like metal-dependent hydrolase (beta-lactamase superfamily II)
MEQGSQLQPIVHTVFEKKSGTWQYIVADPESRHAAIIDSVLDYDLATSTISTKNADELISLVKKEGYIVTYILETHAHGDHLTASYYLQQTLKSAKHPGLPLICIGKRIKQVQRTFADRYGLDEAGLSNTFGRLWEDDEEFKIGQVPGKILHLPGHTPDHVGYIIGSNVFTGDSILNPDLGSARCDFPGGDAAQLWDSTRRLLSLPPHYKLYTGHDYPPQGNREPMPYSTVKEQQETNQHVASGATEEEFVAWRNQRDATLGQPSLMHQALQINIRGGRLPEPNEHGLRLFHVPLKTSAVMSSVL